MGIINPKYITSLVLIQSLEYFHDGLDYNDCLEKTDFHNLDSELRKTIMFLFSQSIRYDNLHHVMIKKFLHQSPQKKYRPYLQALFCAGTTELLLSRTPHNITLSKYTDIVKNDKKVKHLSGMVRAILGQISTYQNDLMPLYDDVTLIFDPVFFKKVKTQYPELYHDILRGFLVKSRLGATILRADYPVPTDAMMNNDRHIILPDGLNPKNMAGIRDGDIIIQSFASSLPVMGLLSVFGNITDKRLYDLCSAPGGKSIQAASYGAKVTAVDISHERMNRMLENIKTTDMTIETHIMSVLDFTPADKADMIMLDAPCSATGTIRKNPDLIAHYSQKDIKSLCLLQEKLLNHAVTLLNTDGILVYATCSIDKSEGEAQIKTFLYHNPEFESFIPELFLQKYPEFCDMDNKIVRILPHHRAEFGGMDGFFIAYLRQMDKKI